MSGPDFERKVNGWLALLWLGLSVPAILWWSQSVPFLVFASVYANFAGHVAAWQAAQSEKRIHDESYLGSLEARARCRRRTTGEVCGDGASYRRLHEFGPEPP